MDTQLPPLIWFNQDPDEDLVHVLLVEEVRVPLNALVEAYFSLPVTENLMAPLTVAAGAVNINLACLCPIPPLSWAPSFMDHNTPYQALLMGRELVARLTDGDNRTRAAPMLDWLRASCTILGATHKNRGHSILHVNLKATTPDARVVKFMRDRLACFQKPANPIFTNPTGGASTGGDPLLPAGTIASQTGEKEYSLLETAKIQAACGIEDAHWETDLQTLYIQMLEEGLTIV
jgi:hypothetical protein